MTFPTTIHTAVGESIIGKVSRWFNGGASDVLTELLQNARRAGATKVHIDQLTEDGQDIVVVRDDGKGIDDPATLLTLGDSGWQEDIARREDPAGMGMFSLAGRQITVRSWSPTADHGWQVTITPDAWESSAPSPSNPVRSRRAPKSASQCPIHGSRTSKVPQRLWLFTTRCRSS